MAGLIIREAGAADHVALERLFTETSMAGAIRIGSDRAPDFFAASRVQSVEPCVWGAFTPEGRAVGVFSAGRRLVHLGGERVAMRYLSDLRIHPGWQGGTLLARGFRALRNKVFSEGEWAQTLVLEQNLPALEALRSGRAGLPLYQPAGRYRNWLLPRQKVRAPALRVRTARSADLPAMQALLDECSPRRSFTAVVDLGTLGEPYLNGLSVGDFLLAEDGGQTLGMMALWDQSRFQRLRVDGYSPGLAAVRPLWNLGTCLHGGIPLPPPGSPLPITKASSIACAGDDPAILRTLLAAALSRDGGRMLSIGLSELDPLASALVDIKGKVFLGLHYLVGWTGEPPRWIEPFGFDPARI